MMKEMEGDEAALQATVLYYLLYSYNGTCDVVIGVHNRLLFH